MRVDGQLIIVGIGFLICVFAFWKPWQRDPDEGLYFKQRTYRLIQFLTFFFVTYAVMKYAIWVKVQGAGMAAGAVGIMAAFAVTPLLTYLGAWAHLRKHRGIGSEPGREPPARGINKTGRGEIGR